MDSLSTQKSPVFQFNGPNCDTVSSIGEESATGALSYSEHEQLGTVNSRLKRRRIPQVSELQLSNSHPSPTQASIPAPSQAAARFSLAPAAAAARAVATERVNNIADSRNGGKPVAVASAQIRAAPDRGAIGVALSSGRHVQPGAAAVKHPNDRNTGIDNHEKQAIAVAFKQDLERPADHTTENPGNKMVAESLSPWRSGTESDQATVGGKDGGHHLPLSSAHSTAEPVEVPLG